ncbi:MAG: MCP four helix bundle domain-containing protein, partial [Thermodesulfovibrio sp.]|nr:MCP four helix bundle domain-containing protein [Thermodesulfovibrio sp.]
MLKKMTIGKKLTLGFGVVIGMVVIMGVVAIYQLFDIETHSKDLDERIDKINMAAFIRKTVKDIYIDIRDLLLTDDIKVREEKRKAIEEKRKAYREKLEELSKITRSEKGKAILKELQDAIADSRDVVNRTMELSFANKNKEAIEFFNREIPKRGERIDKALDALVQFQYESARKRIVEIQASIKDEILIFIVFLSVSTLLGVFFALLISRSVKKPVT